jgi:hypothetical protein
MKSKVKTVVLVLFCLCTFYANAQEDMVTPVDFSTIIAKEVFDSQNKVYVDKSQNTNQFIQNNNLIQVQQIGYYNYADINVRSSNVSMKVNQNGDNNYANVYRNAYDLNENISQTGNNNFISDFSVYSDDPINTSFNQVGNNLTIISNGSNSISKNLQINQTGNSGTVYIYNR